MLLTVTVNIISQYDKAHLFKLMDEHLYYGAWSKDNIFELDECNVWRRYLL